MMEGAHRAMDRKRSKRVQMHGDFIHHSISFFHLFQILNWHLSEASSCCWIASSLCWRDFDAIGTCTCRQRTLDEMHDMKFSCHDDGRHVFL